MGRFWRVRKTSELSGGRRRRRTKERGFSQDSHVLNIFIFIAVVPDHARWTGPNVNKVLPPYLSGCLDVRISLFKRMSRSVQKLCSPSLSTGKKAKTARVETERGASVTSERHILGGHPSRDSAPLLSLSHLLRLTLMKGRRSGGRPNGLEWGYKETTRERAREEGGGRREGKRAV